MNFGLLALFVASNDTVMQRVQARGGSIAQLLTIGWVALQSINLALLAVLIIRAFFWECRVIGGARVGVVAWIDGSLTWRGRRYRAETNGLHLHVPMSVVDGSFPGPYRFYYLPDTRLVAAAEWLGEPLPYAGWFQRHPSFSVASLPFNREGCRSPTQISFGRAWPLFAVEAAAFIVYLLPVFIHGPNDLYVYLAKPALVAIGIFALSDLHRFTDMRPGKVISAEGAIERDPLEVHHFEDTITVGGQRFGVLKWQYDAFAEPYRYRVYYTTSNHGHSLLDAEPIGEIGELAEG